MSREESYEIIKRIRDEYEAVRFALAETLRALSCNPDVQRAGKARDVSDGDLKRCAQNIEITYVIRLFSEFEGIILDFWCNGLKRAKRPAASILIARIAATRKMTPEHRARADDVREYRNDIVHEHLRDGRITFHECKSHLARFLSWLPVRW